MERKLHWAQVTEEAHVFCSKKQTALWSTIICVLSATELQHFPIVPQIDMTAIL